MSKPDRTAEYQRLYDQGHNDSEIGRQCGVSHATVKKWRDANGLPPKHAGNPKPADRATKPEGEEVRPIPAAPGYSISRSGVVYSDRATPAYAMVPKTTAAGPKVALTVNGKLRYFYVAVLVLEAFVGPRPKGQVVGFADRDRTNCDVGNLAWRISASRIDLMEFVRVWQSSLSTAEVAERIGTSYSTAWTTAKSLRRKGVPLKDMGEVKPVDQLAELIALAEQEI